MNQKENAAQAWQGPRGKGTISRTDENVTADIIPRNAAGSKGIGQSERAIG